MKSKIQVRVSGCFKYFVAIHLLIYFLPSGLLIMNMPILVKSQKYVSFSRTKFLQNGRSSLVVDPASFFQLHFFHPL